MDRTTSRFALGGLLAATLCSTAAIAAAWELEAPVEFTVNQHLFSGAKVSSDGCSLTVRIDFDAPKEGYSSRVVVRNYYRFQARLKFSENHFVMSPVFFNRGAGRRTYSFTQDTTEAGCWAKKRLKLYDLDIVGCRGKGCRPDPFAD